MVFIVEKDFPLEDALLASLQYEHRAWFVEYRDVVKHSFRPQYANRTERGLIVTKMRGEQPSQRNQLAAP